MSAHWTFPYVLHMDEGLTVETDFNTITSGLVTKGVPWRVKHVKVEVTASYPVLAQIEIHSAGSDNVESVKSKRLLANQNVRTFNMSPPSPNLWKEDEQRAQKLLRFDNLCLGKADVNHILFWFLEVTFQFGPIAFDNICPPGNSLAVPLRPLLLRDSTASDAPSGKAKKGGKKLPPKSK